MLAVDCGSTAGAAIEWLRERGVEVIVVDHHQVASPPPRAVALVNPQLGPAGGPSFRELCSAGLAFKLAHALVKRGRQEGLAEMREFDLRPYLEWVALGTVADLVPLTGENRILVSSGLARLGQTQRPGLVALKAVAKVTQPVGVYETSFQLAPRLNAAGRLENALAALQLLLTREAAEAGKLALQLDAQNRERQEIERRIAAQVIGSVRARFDPVKDFVIVEGQAAWHLGVVGIVASRVLNEFYRPTFILGGDGPDWRGSGRSIEGFDLAAALRECADLLVRHGGHAMAAGITVKPANLEPFRARLNEIARRTLEPAQLQPALRLDGEIRPADLTFERVRELEKLQHTGMGNPPVQLVMRGLTHQRPRECFGPDKRHVRLWVTDGQAAHGCVWWGGAAQPLPPERFDLACTPQLNEYQGALSIQLKVLDWQAAG
jgi:single-stranded-DNA-specific exonuclease